MFVRRRKFYCMGIIHWKELKKCRSRMFSVRRMTQKCVMGEGKEAFSSLPENNARIWPQIWGPSMPRSYSEPEKRRTNTIYVCLKSILVISWQTDASFRSWTYTLVEGTVDCPWRGTESCFFCQSYSIWMFKAIQPELHLDYITLYSKWQIITAAFDIQCNNINHDEFPFTIHVASIHYFSWIPL